MSVGCYPGKCDNKSIIFLQLIKHTSSCKRIPSWLEFLPFVRNIEPW